MASAVALDVPHVVYELASDINFEVQHGASSAYSSGFERPGPHTLGAILRVVPMVVPMAALQADADWRARRISDWKDNGQRWWALAVRDYESRALPLSYGGAGIQHELSRVQIDSVLHPT